MCTLYHNRGSLCYFTHSAKSLKQTPSASAGMCVLHGQRLPSRALSPPLGLAACLETPRVLLCFDSITYIGQPDCFLKQKKPHT